MKRWKKMFPMLMLLGLLTGCGGFSPKETAVQIGEDGAVTAAVIDKLDQSYYDGEELKALVSESVSSYNGSAGTDTITVEKFEIGETGDVQLFMNYASAADYAAFNLVDFYVGDIADGYNNGGYRFETVFHKVEKGKTTGEILEKEELFEGANYSLVVFSEEMAVEVPGNILYVSENLEVTGKKTARWKREDAAETETPETESEKTESESDDSEVIEGEVQLPEEEVPASTEPTLGYIIYE